MCPNEPLCICQSLDLGICQCHKALLESITSISSVNTVWGIHPGWVHHNTHTPFTLTITYRCNWNSLIIFYMHVFELWEESVEQIFSLTRDQGMFVIDSHQNQALYCLPYNENDFCVDYVVWTLSFCLLLSRRSVATGRTDSWKTSTKWCWKQMTNCSRQIWKPRGSSCLTSVNDVSNIYDFFSIYLYYVTENFRFCHSLPVEAANHMAERVQQREVETQQVKTTGGWGLIACTWAHVLC